MENNPQENQPCQTIHFIISFIKSKNIEISLKDDNFFINSLTKVNSTEIKSLKNVSYEISIYNFKINCNKIKGEEKKDKITIALKDEYNNIFETKININVIEYGKDCFLYDFYFEAIKKFLGGIPPPSSVILTDCEKFGLYVNYIKNDNISEKDKVKKIRDLVYYTQKVFLEKKDNYLLYFYANIFTECYKEKISCLNHIKIFNKDMFNLNEINYGRMELNNNVKEVIASLINDISPIFNHVKDIKEEKKMKQNLVNFLVFFNFFYQKEEINKILENNDINEYCYNTLIQNEKYFMDLKLNKKSMNILVKLCINLEQIKNIFLFNEDFLDLLEISNENFEHIYQLYNNDNRSQSKKIIRYKFFVKPSKKDNIEEIFNQIKILINNENKKKIFIFKFSFDILNKYLEINSESNLNAIITICKISKYIKKNDQLSNMKNINKILNILHNKGLNSIEQHKLNNNEILYYLENDDYYITSSSTKIFMNVLNNFDINSINYDFLSRWKKVNWAKRYKNNKLLFYEKISNLIKEMKSFGYLFEFFDINQEQRDYESDCLNIMEQKYRKLYISKFDKNQDFINHTVDLIYYCERKKYNITSLIKECFYKDKNNNIDILDNIFKKLIEKKEEFSQQLTDIIVDFFNENILKANNQSLKYLLNNLKTKNINSDIIVFLNDYILTKEDIYSINETDNYTIFEILCENSYLEKLGDSQYYKSYLSLNLEIANELDNLNIEYNYINQFYLEKKDNKLYERLLLVVNGVENKNNSENAIVDKNKINNEKKVKKYKENLDKCLNNINCILNDFEYIINFLKYFFPQTQKEIIEKITKFSGDIKIKKMNYYKTNYDFYLTVKNKYLKEAEELNELKNNNLIIELFNNLKKTNNNEAQNFSKIKQFIEIMKIILKENSLKSEEIDPKNLEKFFSEIKMSKQDLSKQISLLAKLLDIKNEINIDNIIEEIFYLSKKSKLINFIEVLLNLLDSFAVRKTYYYSFLKIIHKHMKVAKNFSVIKLSKSIIEKYGFDIDKNNKFENLLLKFFNKKEEYKFLFDKKNHVEIFLKRLKKINNENNNIFEGFDKIFLFITRYMQYNEKKTDKEIINEFKDDINKNENLENYFENYFNKFKLLKENFIN